MLALASEGFSVKCHIRQRDMLLLTRCGFHDLFGKKATNINFRVLKSVRFTFTRMRLSPHPVRSGGKVGYEKSFAINF